MPDEENLNENQPEENKEMRNPYNLPEEVVAEAEEKVPFGDCVQPIGAWWNPDPAEQYVECPIGKSHPDA